ncbi:peptidoglycan recognition protein family protein [Paenibacillus sp. N1-5-1-14]|uniref:N-acetylmuramoyl-L-alanine amidase n=1 Tax=Paenibacillus radicibacter TaxID=2972488 RepID=UPI0021596219|nr:peptidoglycan recognition family protein [Paenibacillus radicibacter]MCR8641572.1 peptidoglycan recognition protein family protein [Paenibacillus radicibacter]
MSYTIKFVGNEHTNSSKRDGNVPCLIVDHISAGSWSSLLSWFTTPNNTVSSSTFGVSKKGEIVQFVDMERMAWANGIDALDITSSKTPIVQEHKGINPNKYSVSIEHEGTDGNLTEEQFQATLWLHKYIRDYVKEKWGITIQLTQYDVIGHYQVSPYKPMCPGKYFPWERLYSELQEKNDEDDENMAMSLSNDAWERIDMFLGNAYNEKIILDWDWVQKARDKKLTSAEFTYIQMIINERRKGEKI